MDAIICYEITLQWSWFDSYLHLWPLDSAFKCTFYVPIIMVPEWCGWLSLVFNLERHDASQKDFQLAVRITQQHIFSWVLTYIFLRIPEHSFNCHLEKQKENGFSFWILFKLSSHSILFELQRFLINWHHIALDHEF